MTSVTQGQVATAGGSCSDVVTFGTKVALHDASILIIITQNIYMYQNDQ